MSKFKVSVPDKNFFTDAIQKQIESEIKQEIDQIETVIKTRIKSRIGRIALSIIENYDVCNEGDTVTIKVRTFHDP